MHATQQQGSLLPLNACRVLTAKFASEAFASVQKQKRPLLLCCMQTCFQSLVRVGLSEWFLKDEQLLRMQQHPYCYSNFCFRINTCTRATGERSDRPSADVLYTHTHTHTHTHTQKKTDGGRHVDEGPSGTVTS